MCSFGLTWGGLWCYAKEGVPFIFCGKVFGVCVLVTPQFGENHHIFQLRNGTVHTNNLAWPEIPTNELCSWSTPHLRPRCWPTRYPYPGTLCRVLVSENSSPLLSPAKENYIKKARSHIENATLKQIDGGSVSQRSRTPLRCLAVMSTLHLEDIKLRL